MDVDNIAGIINNDARGGVTLLKDCFDQLQDIDFLHLTDAFGEKFIGLPARVGCGGKIQNGMRSNIRCLSAEYLPFLVQCRKQISGLPDGFGLAEKKDPIRLQGVMEDQKQRIL